MSPYRIRAVDGSDDEIADELIALQKLTFFEEAPLVKPDDTQYWWIAYNPINQGVAFACLIPSTLYPGYGYFSRVGVLPQHRGRSLQLRFMRAIEKQARRNGWGGVVSDTTDNVPSANNFIRAGYHIFKPEQPWSFPQAIYWRKKWS